MRETYLITGGAGNLTCQLTSYLAAPDRRLVLFDIAPRPAGTMADGCEYVRGDYNIQSWFSQSSKAG